MYDTIIKDVMLDHSFKDSSNHEARHLHEKATMLAASALANSTKGNYGKAWGRYLQFCDKKGLNPIEATGLEVASWLVFKSEQTTSPNKVKQILMQLNALGNMLVSLFPKFLWLQQ